MNFMVKVFTNVTKRNNTHSDRQLQNKQPFFVQIWTKSFPDELCVKPHYFLS